MNKAWQRQILSLVYRLIPIAVIALAGCASESVRQGVSVTLSGGQEAPPVATAASGSGEFTVLPDRSVSGAITTSGFSPTAAHIHEGAPGTNGPVIVPLTKTGDNTFVVPSGAKLTDAQYASYLAGKLYVNAHSAANPGGEVRAQIKPAATAAGSGGGY